MDVVRLDKEGYFVTDLVEGLDNKIWTERFTGMADFGEFEFHSSRISETMLALPETSLISLRDSDVVMTVETHNVVKDGDNGYKVVVKGRACENILEARAWAGARYGKKALMRQKYSVPNAAMVYLYNALVNDTKTDVVSKAATQPTNPLDLIPNLRITDSTVGSPKPKWRYLENSDCWAYLQPALAAGKHGIRSIRPRDGTPPMKTIHVSATGAITKPLETTDGLSFDIYGGVDRTSGQSDVPPVIFSSSAGHLVDSEYLFSSQTYRDVAYVISASGPTGHAQIVERIDDEEHSISSTFFNRVISKYGIRIGEPGPGGVFAIPNSGWDRRVALVDAGSKDDGDTIAEFLASLDDVGSDKLKADFERITSIDGTVSSRTPYDYKVDYDLGDKVTLLGQFGLKQDMMVQEYIRAEDGEGERGIPSLVLWT